MWAVNQHLSSLLQLIDMWQNLNLKKSTCFFPSLLLYFCECTSLTFCWCIKDQLLSHDGIKGPNLIVVIYFLKCINGILVIYFSELRCYTRPILVYQHRTSTHKHNFSFRHVSLTLPHPVSPVGLVVRSSIIKLLVQPNDFQLTQPHFKFWSILSPKF